MNVWVQIYFLIVVNYMIIYKAFLISHSDIMKYIINTLIWLVISILGYIFLYSRKKRYYKYEKEIIYMVIISTLVYILLFYSAGFFIDFSNNPYSKDLNGIIINLFSIVLVLILQEFVRGVLINEVLDKKNIYLYVIALVFIISELNIVMIINNIGSIDLLLTVLIKSIVPIVSINVFVTFLCVKSGVIPGIIYRFIITSSAILIPIIPKYDIIIPMLFDVLFPLFTYLIIMYYIDKDIKTYQRTLVKPAKWILTFLITLFLLMFSLGVFPSKPIVILTGSMKPKINEGDLLIIKKCQIENINVGDIIEFKVTDYNVIHRVTKKHEGINGISLVTKGDNNIKEDKLHVTKENLVGCFKYQIPYLGYPAYLVRSLFKKNIDIETGS